MHNSTDFSSSESSSPAAVVPNMTSSSLASTAIHKLEIAAYKFNKEKDGIWLNTFERVDIEVPAFKEALRNGLNCKLTNAELETLIPMISSGNDKSEIRIDGPKFLLLFYKLRFQHKGKVLSDKIQNDRQVSIRSHTTLFRIKIEYYNI
jgi:hypothetical protein